MTDRYMIFVPGSTTPPSGPFTLAAVEDGVRSGKIAANSQAQKVGEIAWVPVTDLVKPVEASNGDEFYVSSGDGNVVGPVTLDQLRRGVEAGKVPSDVVVCPVGGTEWKPIGEVLPPTVEPQTVSVASAPEPLRAPQPIPATKTIPWKPIAAGIGVLGVSILGLAASHSSRTQTVPMSEKAASQAAAPAVPPPSSMPPVPALAAVGLCGDIDPLMKSFQAEVTDIVAVQGRVKSYNLAHKSQTPLEGLMYLERVGKERAAKAASQKALLPALDGHHLEPGEAPLLAKLRSGYTTLMESNGKYAAAYRSANLSDIVKMGMLFGEMFPSVATKMDAELHQQCAALSRATPKSEVGAGSP